MWLHHGFLLRHTKQYTQETNNYQECNYYVTVHRSVILPCLKFGTCHFTTWMVVQMFKEWVLMFRSISLIYIFILHNAFLSETLTAVDNIPSQ